MKENAAKKCNQLHQQAMEFADKALLNEKVTKHAQAKKQYEQAFQLEKQAAMLLVEELRKAFQQSQQHLQIVT